VTDCPTAPSSRAAAPGGPLRRARVWLHAGDDRPDHLSCKRLVRHPRRHVCGAPRGDPQHPRGSDAGSGWRRGFALSSNWRSWTASRSCRAGSRGGQGAGRSSRRWEDGLRIVGWRVPNDADERSELIAQLTPRSTAQIRPPDRVVHVGDLQHPPPAANPSNSDWIAGVTDEGDAVAAGLSCASRRRPDGARSAGVAVVPSSSTRRRKVEVSTSAASGASSETLRPPQPVRGASSAAAAACRGRKVNQH